MAYDPFPTFVAGQFNPMAPSSSRSVRPRVLKATFGDGYVQRTGDGINQVPCIFNFRSRPLKESEVDSVDAFLTAKRGVTPFTVLMPNESVRRQFTCEDWTITWDTPLYATVTAVFVENFDP